MGNVEVVNIDHLFLIFIFEDTTTAAIPVLSLKIDSDPRPVSHATLESFSPILAPALLVLQEFLTPNFWCATGEVTLLFARGEGGPSERWEGSSTKFANAVLAFTFPPGSTLLNSSMQGRPITSTGEHEATTRQVGSCLVQDDLMFFLS